MSTSSRSHHLTGIAFSHYVEKARWALDRFGVEYTEARYMPMLHLAPVFLLHQGRRGARDKVSSRFSTPVLRTPDGALLCDSGEIVRYISNRYAPPGEALYSDDTDEAQRAMEQRLHDRLGPHSRRIVYAVCFRAPTLLVELARSNVGRAQSAGFELAFPLIRSVLSRGLAINEEAERRSQEIVRSELQWISERLADGRRYLIGDRFSATDLAFACMAAPCVMPPEYGVILPPIDALPADARGWVSECRATPAGQFALRLFTDERRRVVR